MRRTGMMMNSDYCVCRAAATELGVLQDVLSIAREKRYMVLDPVSNDTQEVRSGMVLTAKRKVYPTI